MSNHEAICPVCGGDRRGIGPETCPYPNGHPNKHNPPPVSAPPAPPESRALKKQLKKQVGGTHYKDMSIQPIEYIMANELGFCEGNAVKYITRWRAKNGVEDLKKAIHYIEMLIEQEEGDGT